ncbi:unnamed protein product, partial [Musa hybrid cultivar]
VGGYRSVLGKTLKRSHRRRRRRPKSSRGIRCGLKLLSHAEAADRSGKFLSLSPIESHRRRLGLGALLSVLNPDVGFLLGHFWSWSKLIDFMAVTRGFHAASLKRTGGHGHDEPF